MVTSRRIFIKAVAFLMGSGIFQLRRGKTVSAFKASLEDGHNKQKSGEKPSHRLGVDQDGMSSVFLVRGGTPEENTKKLIELMGGIEKFIGSRDIVVLKPNAQWWNQGMTNTEAMKAFIDIVLAIPNFSGEVIIAENHQYNPANSRGWTTKFPNGKFNLNGLVEFFQQKGHKNVTKYHWQVGGTVKIPLQGDAQGCRRVKGPEEGDGYVWMEDCYYLSPTGKKCLMTYPIFTSSHSGITVDLRNGAWRDGQYLKHKPVRFINFSALNHHSRYCGVTASVKNLMGVVDMTCGFPGDEPVGTYNTHYIGVNKKIEWRRWKFIWRIARWQKFIDYCYRNFYYTGGALGYFMKEVRMPDLNIITAHWVGWGSRTDPHKSCQPKAILASRDPVALDYIATRHILYPCTPPDIPRPEGDKTYKELNDPDNENGPFRKFLCETQKQGIGNLKEEKIRVIYHRLGKVAT